VSSVNTDPLRVIAAQAPRFSAEDAVAIAAQHYGLHVSATELTSERDRNFRLRTEDGREFVLKIGNAAEAPLVTEFQIEALMHIEAQQTDVAVPRMVRTQDGRTSINIRSYDESHVARLVTFLPGVPLARRPLSVELCRNLGVYAAKLDRALLGFEHPGSNQSLLWNMNEAGRVREISHHIPDRRMREMVGVCLDRFDSEVFPLFTVLRSQVIHNDLNPENVLVAADDDRRVVGVIDFGDMVRSPLVVDVAVTASYMRDLKGNPLSPIAQFVAAWHSVTPLEHREIDLVMELIFVRLATTVSVLHWRIAERGPGDPYLNNSASAESTAARFLEVLWKIPRDYARHTLRQACASVDAAGARRT
jgi:hydroxylysine kinase